MCTWNATQLSISAKNNASSIDYPVMMPETYNFDISLSDPTLNDAAARLCFLYRFASLRGHNEELYNALNKGKKLWMTEYYLKPR